MWFSLLMFVIQGPEEIPEELRMIGKGVVVTDLLKSYSEFLKAWILFPEASRTSKRWYTRIC